jgi:hypothetical protein
MTWYSTLALEQEMTFWSFEDAGDKVVIQKHCVA